MIRRKPRSGPKKTNRRNVYLDVPTDARLVAYAESIDLTTGGAAAQLIEEGLDRKGIRVPSSIEGAA